MANGIVIKGVGGIYEVLSEDITYTCRASTKLQKDKQKLVVGDKVEFDILNNLNGYIKKIYPRRNYLNRPPVANIDQAIIVMSLVEPSFSTYLLDKYMLQILDNDIEPIIYLSKKDKVDNLNEYKEQVKTYVDHGYKVYFANSKVPDENKKFYELLKGKKSILTGQSGAGKSTFLNSLDPNLNILTGDYSPSLGRGRHTTREVSFINIYDGLIADTPGFSSLDINIPLTRLATIYPCFKDYAPFCKFRDCLHDTEHDCKVKEALNKGLISKSTYDNYLKILKEVREKRK